MNEPTPTPAAPEPIPVRKCEWANVVPKDLDGLLATAPNNPYCRTLLHNVVKLPPPPEADTYEKLKEWVELNIEIKKVAVKEPVGLFANVPNGPQFAWTVRQTGSEWGRCSFNRAYAGQDAYILHRADLQRIAADSEDWYDFVDMVRGELRENCCENPPDYEPDYNSTTYEDHEVDESSTEETTLVHPEDLEASLERFMSEHLPDTLEEIRDL